MDPSGPPPSSVPTTAADGADEGADEGVDNGADEGAVDVERFVAGGLGLGHLPDGRVVLVAGGLPGDRVVPDVTDDGARLVRAGIGELLVASPQRVPPPCPELVRGCGGCDLQHARPHAQRDLKVAIVTDALRRIAHRPDLPVDPGTALPDLGYRTTVRAAVVGGRAGFHGRRSDTVVAVDGCMVTHPSLAELLVDGRFGDAEEVVLRVGARTGDRMAVLRPTAADAVLPPDVRVVGTDELAAGRRVWIHEEVAGRRLRVSARSFFQARPDGAEALVGAVGRALGPIGGAHLVDLYGGVGLFSACLAGDGGPGRVTLVERSADAVADARVNLGDLDATVVRVAVERWRPAPADVVVADPSRRGLRAEGVRAVAATGAERVALVSCDPAALARDVALLGDGGYDATGVELVDLFPHTHHVEAVTTFVRRPDRAVAG